MGLLGGFLLTAYIKSEKKAITVDAQLISPRHFGVSERNISEVEHGAMSVAVPGFLKGLWEIHKKYGSVPWKDLVEPTIGLCNEGIIITKHLHDSMHINKGTINDPYLNEILMNHEVKKFKRTGSKLNIEKHCKFLALLATQNGSNIFSGPVGDMIAKDFEDAGTVITQKDLIEYKVKWKKAIEFPLTDDSSLFVPNTAAVLVPSIVNVLKEFRFNGSNCDGTNINETILTHHRIVEAFKHVFAVRSRLGDPDYVDVDEIVNHMLSPEFAQKVVAKIDDTKTFFDPEKYSAKYASPDDDGTSHISIVASNGDAISATSSINY